MSFSEKDTREALTCKQVVELVTDYLEGVLSPALEARVGNHLADCEHCPRYVEQIREAIRLAGQAKVEDLDEQTRGGLLEAFKTWHRGGVA